MFRTLKTSGWGLGARVYEVGTAGFIRFVGLRDDTADGGDLASLGICALPRSP